MPTFDDHVALANRNHATLECLIAAGVKHSPWIATTAFYKALHVIEAMFAKLPSKRRSTTHGDRDLQLRSETRFQNLLQNYRSLQTTSQIARYLSDTSGTGFRSFEDYMPGSKVLSEMVHHRLHQIEVGVTKLMGAGSLPGLLRCSSLPRTFSPDLQISATQQSGGSAG